MKHVMSFLQDLAGPLCGSSPITESLKVSIRKQTNQTVHTGLFCTAPTNRIIHSVDGVVLSLLLDQFTKAVSSLSYLIITVDVGLTCSSDQDITPSSVIPSFSPLSHVLPSHSTLPRLVDPTIGSAIDGDTDSESGLPDLDVGCLCRDNILPSFFNLPIV